MQRGNVVSVLAGMKVKPPGVEHWVYFDCEEAIYSVADGFATLFFLTEVGPNIQENIITWHDKQRYMKWQTAQKPLIKNSNPNEGNLCSSGEGLYSYLYLPIKGEGQCVYAMNGLKFKTKARCIANAAEYDYGLYRQQIKYSLEGELSYLGESEIALEMIIK